MIAGRIGPNAIIQTAAALERRVGWARADAILWRAVGRHLDEMPDQMVDEAEVIALIHELRETMGSVERAAVLREAGRRTADYLIAHRIPRPAQWLMRLVPRAVGLRLLLAGIARHTWTFAGTARVRIETGDPTTMSLSHCPMCRGMQSAAPCCDYYVGTLEHLLQRLISPDAVVEEVACEAAGAAACVMRLGFTPNGGGAPPD